MTPDELLDRAAQDSGKDSRILSAMLRNARWTPARLGSEIESAGWLQRLEADLIEVGADKSVARIGPAGARELTDAECMRKITPKLRKAVETYNGGSALLLGATGVGKSLAARLMLAKQGRRWVRDAYARQPYRLEEQYAQGVYTGICWAAAIELALAVSRHPLGKGAPDEVDEARNATLLAIDDLTWPKNDEVTLEILASRYDSGKPTIATAGCSRLELTQRFGDAVVRRLLESRGVKGLLVEA